jgi:hypothetical protein
MATAKGEGRRKADERETVDARSAEAIRVAVAAAPPLTAEQARFIRGLLWPERTS